MRTKIVWLFLVIGTLACANPSQAAEQRCNDLGANCACSEPLNTPTLAVHNTFWLNPADSITKECSKLNSIAGPAIEVSGPNLTATNASAILNRLPGGHSVSWVLRGNEGHTGTWDVGASETSTNGLSGRFLKRAAIRFYIYHSSNFAFDAEGAGGACTNGKLAEVGSSVGQNHLDLGAGGNAEIQVYNFTAGFQNPVDCCGTGPGGERGTNVNDFRDKWARLEMIMINRAPGLGPWRVIVYYKDVTNNGPEVKVIDTGASIAGEPLQTMHRAWSNFHRAGTCPGFRAESHVLVAGWDTDAGQRIGPASEIEAGGGSPPLDTIPPAPPINMRAE